MKIAIIDDEVGTINRLRELLEGEGYVVFGVTCGYNRDKADRREGIDLVSHSSKEIVESVRQFSPDLVFLDHFLNERFEGDLLAEELGMDRSRLFGVSSVTQYYCGERIRKDLLHKSSETRDIVRKDILEAIARIFKDKNPAV